MTHKQVYPIAEVLSELMSRYEARGLLADGPSSAGRDRGPVASHSATAAAAAGWIGRIPPAAEPAMSACLMHG